MGFLQESPSWALQKARLVMWIEKNVFLLSSGVCASDLTASAKTKLLKLSLAPGPTRSLATAEIAQVVFHKPNIAENYKTRAMFLSLTECTYVQWTWCCWLRTKAAILCEITHNNGHWPIQGHWLWYQRKTCMWLAVCEQYETYTLHHTISKLSRHIGQIIAFDSRVSPFSTPVLGKPLYTGLQNLASKN